MVAFKCKMCGGDLNITPDATVCVCEFCDTQQTVPTVDNQKKANLFNRANRLRMSSDFDAAATVYQNIVAEFPDEAEAYWGLCLCKYGIEYVDDILTGHKIPTCHRTHFESIHDDQNYKQACDLADSIAKGIFLKEADAIDQLQKDILSIVDSEKPYDVFICYKESDADGSRTEDSVLAQEIYDALSDMNYRIFFSRISLEDKLGREYEPYIYAALHSARVMLVVGTCYEYFDAAWVKNEWKRFLDMAKTDKRKVLIPCYKGIEPEDIPPEMRRLQAQDMNKLGFMQDLVRGIKKIISSKQDESPSLAQTNPKDTAEEMLMRHARVSLEDKDWERAQEYIDRILEINPEYAPAYIGKIMIELKVSKEDELGLLRYYVRQWIKRTKNWNRAIRFATPENRLIYEDYVKPNDEQSDGMQYRRACNLLEIAQTQSTYMDAEQIFQRIVDYSDSKLKIKLCQEKRKQIRALDKDELEYLAYKRKICSTASKLITFYSFDLYGLSVDGHILTTKPYDHDNPNEGMRAWQNKGVIAISSSYQHAVGLKSDGTTVAIGKDLYNQFDVTAWRDITAIAVGREHAVGLKADGTVVATGNNYEDQCNVKAYNGWTNIVSISAGDDCTAGVKKDGTVIITGRTIDDSILQETNSWKDIVSVSINSSKIVGLKVDGTVVSAGYDEDIRSQMSNWTGIVAVYVDGLYTIGLGANGLVYYVGSGFDLSNRISNSEDNWSHIIAIAFESSEHIVGLRDDGRLVSTYTTQYDREQIKQWQLFENDQYFIDIERQQAESLRVYDEEETKWRDELTNAEAQMKRLSEKKICAERELNSLNIFQIKRKQELRKEIYDLVLALKDIREDIYSLKNYGYIHLGKDEYRDFD